MLAFLAVLDTAAWLWATRAIQSAVADWAQRQRAMGVDVTLSAFSAGGWPIAAAVGFSVRVGPAGVPGGGVLDASLDSRLSLARATVLVTAISSASLTAPGGGVVTAGARHWSVEASLAEPDRATMQATDLRLSWAGRHVDIAALSTVIMAGGADPSLVASADGIDLAGGGASLPPPFGPVIRAVALDATLHGGPPPVAVTAEASARAWRDGAGRIEVRRLSLGYGPLDASMAGQFGLDAALRPSGEATITARGLAPLLDALGGSGVIPARSAQAAGGVLALLGGGQTPRIPVTLADGQLSVLRFPLARLPRMAWEPQ